MTNSPSKGAVLLVEDDAMIRMMVADMLGGLGYSIAGEAANVDDGVRLAQSASYDVALLDVNLDGEMVTPVAQAVVARSRPVVFISGYGVDGLPEDFRGRPALQKPFRMALLDAALEEVLKK